MLDAASRDLDRGRDRIVAIVPIGTLAGAKSRLGEVLDAEERLDLATSLARATIAAGVASERIAETLFVTPGDAVPRLPPELGAPPVPQRGGGGDPGTG